MLDDPWPGGVGEAPAQRRGGASVGRGCSRTARLLPSLTEHQFSLPPLPGRDSGECNSLCVHTCPAMFQLPVLRPRHRGRLHHQPWLDPVTGMWGDPGAPSSRYHSSYHGNQQVLLKVQKTDAGMGWRMGTRKASPRRGGAAPQREAEPPPPSHSQPEAAERKGARVGGPDRRRGSAGPRLGELMGALAWGAKFKELPKNPVIEINRIQIKMGAKISPTKYQPCPQSQGPGGLE